MSDNNFFESSLIDIDPLVSEAIQNEWEENLKNNPRMQKMLANCFLSYKILLEIKYKEKIISFESWIIAICHVSQRRYSCS